MEAEVRQCFGEIKWTLVSLVLLYILKDMFFKTPQKKSLV